eukprot:COSAG02_NODE_2814_length_7971_cov_4.403455_5_plen_42_part_00
MYMKSVASGESTDDGDLEESHRSRLRTSSSEREEIVLTQGR